MIVKKYKMEFLFVLFFFLTLGLYIYKFFNEPYLIGSIEKGFIVADSIEYYEKALAANTFTELLNYYYGHKNSLGPILFFYYIAQKNLVVLFIVHFLLLFSSLYFLVKSLKLHRILVVLCILLNLSIIGSLSGPNKEILSLISILFVSSYIMTNKIRFFIFAIVLSFFTRIEFIFVLMTFLALKFIPNNTRIIGVIFMVILLSLIIKITGYSSMEHLQEHAREGSFGFVIMLDKLSQAGFYFIVLPIRLVINLYAEVLLGFKRFDFSLLIYLSNILFLVFSFFIITKRRLSIKNDFILLIAIYVSVFCVPSFIQHRYFIPIYPLFVIAVFTPPKFFLIKKTNTRKSDDIHNNVCL